MLSRAGKTRWVDVDILPVVGCVVDVKVRVLETDGVLFEGRLLIVYMYQMKSTAIFTFVI